MNRQDAKVARKRKETTQNLNLSFLLSCLGVRGVLAVRLFRLRAFTMTGLRVVRVGPGVTVQDRGRAGFREFGVPVGGAFDRGSMALANALVGNGSGTAVLEFTLAGGEFAAEVPLGIAIAGAPMTVTFGGRPLAVPGSATLRAGETMIVGGTRVGARAYLAVRGGWQTPVVLGSRSSEPRVVVGDVLPAESSEVRWRRPVAWPWAVDGEGGPIRVVDGPDNGADGRVLEGAEFAVSNRSDRMGLRLEGPAVDFGGPPDRASAPVAAGAVQVAGGRPIVLGVAGGTMGGYPHLAQVISADLDRIGQLRPGDRVRFRRIGIEEARGIDAVDRIDRARWLARVGAISRDDW